MQLTILSPLVIIFGFLCLPDVSSDCRLQPISFGLYYGIQRQSMESAKSCCEEKGLQLPHADTPEERNTIRNALVSESFRSPPIGPEDGVFVNATHQNHTTFYPRRLAGNTSESLCTVAYLSSPHNVSLDLDAVSCRNRFRFLCQSRSEQIILSSKCHSLNMTEIIEDEFIFFNTKLEWRDARDCCEIHGGELYRKRSASQDEDIIRALDSNNGLLDTNGQAYSGFWTGAFKKLDKPEFTWSNSETAFINYINLSEAEFCLKASASKRSGILLEDHPCESSLNALCRIRVPKKCPYVNMEEIKIENTFRKYHYSGAYKLPWSEAVLCCQERGAQLFTLISPQEGNALAAYFQTSPILEHKHQGYAYGLWTSGRQRKDGTIEFVSTRTRTKARYDNHFIQGSSNGTCFQYVIDTRNSYFLNNIPCKSIRSFICEDTGRIVRNDILKLAELGNKYFISQSKETWDNANFSCFHHEMGLLDLYSNAEKKSLSPILEYFSSGNTDGFWSARRVTDPIIIDTKKARSEGKDTLQPKKLGKIINSLDKINHRPSTQDEFQPCTSTVLVSGKFIISNNNSCTDRKHYICEQQGSEYGNCKTSAFQRIGNFTLSKHAATWAEAKACCERIEKSLVSLTAKNKRTTLYDLLVAKEYLRPNLGAWTSGNNRIIQEKFVWTYEFLRHNIFYNDYAVFDEPSGAEDDNQCLEVFADTINGKSVIGQSDCDIAKPFVCDEPKPEKSCTNIRLEQLRRSTYYYAYGKVKWLQAEECCKQRNMRLAEIQDPITNGELGKHITEESNDLHDDPGFGVWIGLTSHLSNHAGYSWVGSGRLLNSSSYSNWDIPIKMPINAKTDCVEAYIDSKTQSLVWKASSCSLRRRFLCVQ